MKVSAEFQNGICRLIMTPSDEWEKKLLGAVAKGEDKLSAVVKYEPEGHFSYGKCRAVQVQLEAGGHAIAAHISRETGESDGH